MKALTDISGMVFVHGSLSNASQWKDMLTLLPPGMRSECPTLLGYAPGKAFDPTYYSLHDEVDVVIACLDRIGMPAALVGHSFGGAVAIGAALRRPDLVERLVLIEPVVFALLDKPDTADAFACALAFCNDVPALLGEGRSLDAAQRFFSFWELTGLWNSFDERRKNFVAQAMPKLAAECAQIHRPTYATADIAEGLRMPVLLLQGALSPALTHKVTDVLYSCLPHADVGILPTGNHLSPVFQPHEVLAHILDFVL